MSSGSSHASRVDMPNTWDHLWGLDIKKSSAIPPPGVTSDDSKISRTGSLARVGEFTCFAGAVLKRTRPDQLCSLVDENEFSCYDINLDHPLIVSWQTFI